MKKIILVVLMVLMLAVPCMAEVKPAGLFSVEGTYEQIRSLLASLQASPQFLIVDSISFKGEEDARSQILSIRLQVSTYLAEAELGKLRALVDRTRLEVPAAAPEAEAAS